MKSNKGKAKMRKSTKYISITLVSIMFAIFSGIIYKEIWGNKTYTINKEIYKHTDKFSYDYKVNLKENKYITEKTLGKEENAYVTDLIENINININYIHDSNQKSIKEYTYTIKGIIKGVYTRDNEEQGILEKEYILKEPTTLQIEKEDIIINEKLILDLTEENDLIHEFEQDIGISVDALYNVVVEVKMSTDVEDKKIENIEYSSLNISLGDKTTVIKLAEKENIEKKIYKEIQYTEDRNNVLIALSIILLLVSIKLYIGLLTNTQIINKTKNEFKQELNRILRLCQDKIVQVNQYQEDSNKNTIIVKDFGEILKVSEELFKPILYWISPKNNEAYFTIVSEEIIYRYVLKKK